jgi:hypothetical protein
MNVIYYTVITDMFGLNLQGGTNKNTNTIIIRLNHPTVKKNIVFDRSHPVVFRNNIVIYSVNKHNIYW